MFISTDEFVGLELPKLMSEDRFSKYRVLFATYNDAGDVPVSPMPGDCQGLEVTTRSGNLAYTVRFSDARANEQMDRQAEAAVATIVRGTDFDTERFDLAVVYLGLTGFDKGLTYALNLKRRDTAREVAVLTCDCDQATKAKKLDRPLRSRDVRSALLTKRCGGQADFEALYRGIVETWPRVRAA